MVEDARRYGEITIEHHSMEGLAHRSHLHADVVDGGVDA
jgi:hypothetical protein